MVQGGLGSADDVEYVAVLLSKRNLSLILSSLSLFFKSKYSLWEQIRFVFTLVKSKDASKIFTTHSMWAQKVNNCLRDLVK